MKPREYVETTIPSYLVARPSRDLIVAAHQQITREWWDLRVPDFDIFISAAVVDEVSAGDPTFAVQRMELLRGVVVLEITDVVIDLAEDIMKGGFLPDKARLDAIHVATAASHAMDYLLTWNCRHIANGVLMSEFQRVCRQRGMRLPLICTPEFLMENQV